MFDIERRIADMDAAGVDIALISLTCPSVYWGDEAVSSGLARRMNDHWVAAERAFPERIRWLATLPWLHRDAALEELARADGEGAVGVFVAANLDGKPLTDPAFDAIWREIERRELPVLVHPTTPPGMGEMDLRRYNLVASVGFMFDTTLAFARMILDGFLDRYPDLRWSDSTRWDDPERRRILVPSSAVGAAFGQGWAIRGARRTQPRVRSRVSPGSEAGSAPGPKPGQHRVRSRVSTGAEAGQYRRSRVAFNASPRVRSPVPPGPVSRSSVQTTKTSLPGAYSQRKRTLLDSVPSESLY